MCNKFSIGISIGIVIGTIIICYLTQMQIDEMYQKIAVVIGSIIIWHLTQIYLSNDIETKDRIVDRVHDSYMFTTINRYLHDNHRIAKYNFILSSFLIDINVGYMIWQFFTTYDVTPAIIFLTGVSLRQLCQYINRLPIPNSVVWFYPDFPSIIVTYYVTNDFFFSGHTYVAMCSGVEIIMNSGMWGKIYGLLFILYEIMFIFSIHGHYFMDVYGAITTYFMLSYFFR